MKTKNTITVSLLSLKRENVYGVIVEDAPKGAPERTCQTLHYSDKVDIFQMCIVTL